MMYSSQNRPEEKSEGENQSHDNDHNGEPESPTNTTASCSNEQDDIPLSDDEQMDNISQNVEKFWEAYSESEDDDELDSSSDIENYVCIDINGDAPKKKSEVLKS